MKNKNQVIVADQILVGTGKSSRLAAMAKKSKNNNASKLNNKSHQHSFNTSLKPKTKEILQQTAQLIDQGINEILDGFPDHKRHSYFKLRYGIEVSAIKKMMIKDIFAVLKLDSAKSHHFKDIENLDLSGNTQSVDRDE